MASYFITSIAPGQWFYSTDASPDAVISATRGSVAIRTDAGNESLWINVSVGAAPSTNWERIISPNINGDLDLTGVDQITLLDNANPALDIGSTGLLNLLRFVTTNGAEALEYNGISPLKVNTGGLNVVAGTVAFPASTVSLATAGINGTSGTVVTPQVLRVDVGAGATVNTVLPARTNGFRVIDAWIVSGGATAGTITVQTTAPANVSSAMVPGNAGQVTRTGDIANATFASGATIRVTGAGNPASVCYISLLPL